MFVLRFGLILLLTLMLAGCATRPVRAPLGFDRSSPEWTVYEGQAVWKHTPETAGIAGDLLVAIARDGRSWVEFSKPPLPIVAAVTESNRWQVTFGGQQRTYRGRGRPPERILWLHLPAALQGRTNATRWQLKATSAEEWRFAHAGTGESLSGYFQPAPASARTPGTEAARP